MVAYSFKKSFGSKILCGEKRQTIRLPRKRHARPGEELQLFTGMRTKYCRKLGVATCAQDSDIVLDFLGDQVVIGDSIQLATLEELDAFATADGFALTGRLIRVSAWDRMRRWWALTHGDVDRFSGVLIEWDDSFRGAA